MTALANWSKETMNRRLKNVFYAASAGMCGSSAGTFGKIGMGVDEFFGIDDRVSKRTEHTGRRPLIIVHKYVDKDTIWYSFFFFNLLYGTVFLFAQALYTNLARFAMVAMVVLTNIGVWLMYTRSLRYGSTLTSTGISIASNYIFTVSNLWLDLHTHKL